MARPQAADYRDRKKKIADVASDIFATDGYHKASINQIAKACDMSKSLIYHYYPSKQDILYHAMIYHVRHLDRMAQAVIAEDLPAKDALQRIIKDYLYVYSETVSQHHLMINELSSLSRTQKKEVISLQNNVVKAFSNLAEGITKAPIRKHKAKSVLAMLMLGMINWTYIWFKPNGPVTTDQLASIITKMFIGGLENLDENTFS